jgi:UDP-N-acetylglucosamine:LPS N-acetylglucosamine transferase
VTTNQTRNLPVTDGFDTGGEWPARVLLVGSSGGHLAQLLALRPWWTGRHCHWVTFRTPDAESQLDGHSVTWAYFPTTRNLVNAVRNLWLAVRDLRRERPDLVVSTGAGVAFPYFIVARLMRIRTAYIEVYDRIDTPTMTGRLCAPLTTLFCVQWDQQQELYPSAVTIGSLL